MRLYHATPRAADVLRRGLSPRYDRRGKGRVWLCDALNVLWAIDHVAITHNVPREKIVVLAVDADELFLRRHREGIYWTSVWTPPARIGPSVVLLI